MRSPKPRTKQIVMLLAALVVGVLISLQWTASATRSVSASDQVARTMRQLELAQAELKREVGRLRTELDSRQKEAVADAKMLEDLRSELARQRAYAGLSEVRGPGVQVILDDSQLAVGGSTNDQLVHDYDLRDAISVLWLSGAEAIAVNGERIVNSTSVVCVGTTIMVNDTRLSPPYEISAIGDPTRMQDYLRNPGYLAELKARRRRAGLRMDFIRIDMLTLPTYQGSIQQQYAHPGS